MGDNMKRKIVKHGPSSLTVSLPMVWVKQNNLKSGDEVNIEIKGNQLNLSTDSILESEKIELDVSGLGSMIHRMIGAAYKAGYDEILVKYNNSEELKIIIDEVGRACLGFDICHQKNGKILIKSLSVLNPNEFNVIFRKITYLLKDIGEELIEAMKKNENNIFEELILKDKNIDKYTNFCRRLLNKRVSNNFLRPKAVYSVLEDLEMIGDGYKDICRAAINVKNIPKEAIDLMKEINKMIELIHILIFNPNKNTALEFGKVYDSLKKKIEKIDYKKDYIKLFFEIEHMFKITFDIKSALFTEVLPKIK